MPPAPGLRRGPHGSRPAVTLCPPCLGRRAPCGRSTPKPAGSTPSRSLPRRCAGGSCSSTSGPTRASTGCAPCPTSARGTSDTATAASSLIGAHAPEFGFEHDLEQRAAGERRSSGVVIPGRDRQRVRDLAARSTNHYWPALYLLERRRRAAASSTSGRGTTRRSSGRSRVCWGSRSRTAQVDAGGLAQAVDLDALRLPGDLPGQRPRRTPQRAVAGTRSRSTTGRLHGTWSIGGEVAELSTAPGFDLLPLPGARCEPGLSRAAGGRGLAVRISVRLDGVPPGRRPRPRHRPLTARARSSRAVRMYSARSASRRWPRSERSRSRSSDPGARAYVFTFG